MALKIVWTRQAENGYDNIIKYLEENWTDREIRNFIQEHVNFWNFSKRIYIYWNPLKPENMYIGDQSIL
jgi:hypothetical protein